jgi:hypothetical protein
MFFVDLSVVDREDMVTEALAAAVGYLPREASCCRGCSRSFRRARP